MNTDKTDQTNQANNTTNNTTNMPANNLKKTKKYLILNKLQYSDIQSFPIKLQIYFILRFWSLSTLKEINELNELVNLANIKKIKLLLKNNKTEKTEETNSFSDQTVNDLIFKIIENTVYEVFGILYSSFINWTVIKNDYINLWNDIVIACIWRQQFCPNCANTNYTNFTNFNGIKCYYDVPFEIIMSLCEIYDLPINIEHIPLLINTHSYTEDNAIYMLKSPNIKFNIKKNENLSKMMKIFEIMYDDSIKKKYKILEKIIRCLPYFLTYLPKRKIIEIVTKYPDTLNYNLNSNEITFDILDKSNEVISIKLKKLSTQEIFKDFESTNKIIGILLEERLVLPIDEKYNKVFFNFYYKINKEMGNNVEYQSDTNYSEKLLQLHLEIMGRPIC